MLYILNSFRLEEDGSFAGRSVNLSVGDWVESDCNVAYIHPLIACARDGSF